MTLDILNFPVIIANADDIGPHLRQGVVETECLQYEDKVFSLTCNFAWNDPYDENDYILLRANEVFNGNDYEIDLQAFNSWEGLFRIDADVGWDHAPVITHLHVTGGRTSYEGGFVVQSDQKNFIVDSCSSSGTVEERRGGGICGHQCSGTIRLINCWSTGLIGGTNAGGIAGRRLAFEGGSVHITNCWSDGEIRGSHAGGICGSQAGGAQGVVTIIKSYSKGDIIGLGSGGICGASATADNGQLRISQCYTVGDIDGDGSGGIIGWRGGRSSGHIDITNCYTQGNIEGGGSDRALQVVFVEEIRERATELSILAMCTPVEI